MKEHCLGFVCLSEANTGFLLFEMKFGLVVIAASLAQKDVWKHDSGYDGDTPTLMALAEYLIKQYIGNSTIAEDLPMAHTPEKLRKVANEANRERSTTFSSLLRNFLIGFV